MELLIGILCGILLSLLFSFGPAFIGLIQSSIQYGFQRAMAFVIGVSISDILVVFLMLTVLKNVDMGAVMHNPYVACIGGAGIIVFGIYCFRKKTLQAETKGRLKFCDDGTTKRRHLLFHGFLLNTINPFIWIYWISVIAVLSAEVGLNDSQRYVFFAGLLFATLGCDMLKCRLSSLLQTWFTARVMNLFNKATGIIMIAFGIYLVIAMVLYQKNSDIIKEPTPNSTKIIKSLHKISKDTTKQNDDDTIYWR